MGRVITEVYWRDIVIPKFNEEELISYSLAWQNVFAHKNVGLLDPKVVGTRGVLIALQPIYVPAATDHGIVATTEISKYNPDWTAKFRHLFRGKPIQVKAKIKALKVAAAPIIKDYIIIPFFHDLVGVDLGFNLWLSQLNGVFITAT